MQEIMKSEYDNTLSKSFNDPQHRALRYILKVGDLEEAIHVFVDLLEMRVFRHLEYEEGSPDGGDVHYEGQWSRTLVGYGKTEYEQFCLQLTLNHGITKYARGNHVHSIVVQLANTDHLEDIGLRRGVSCGRPAFFIDCDGYVIEVVKSVDGKNQNRIGCIILNCDEPITLSGPTVRFWTECLGFEIVCWSTDPNKDIDHLIEYTNLKRFNFCCCFVTRVMKKKSEFKPLGEGELPYVELQYGSSTDFCLRLQSLPKGVPIDIGTGKERLILTCSRDNLDGITKRVNVLGRKHGGTETKKSFQILPGKLELVGVITTDHSGLEVCFYDDEEVRFVYESQLDADMLLRQSIIKNRRKLEARMRKGSKSVRLQI